VIAVLLPSYSAAKSWAKSSPGSRILLVFDAEISAAATFEGEFSDVTRSYAGKGVVRYMW
jgi:hypothetical protein